MRLNKFDATWVCCGCLSGLLLTVACGSLHGQQPQSPPGRSPTASADGAKARATKAQAPAVAAERKEQVTTAADAPRQTLIVVVGIAGEKKYGQQFRAWADRWRSAASKGGVRYVQIGGQGAGILKRKQKQDDRTRLRALLEKAAEEKHNEPLWIVLIGHGTFNGRQAKFNLRGPDVTAKELGEWLARVPRPLAIVNCTSASGPFINRLSGSNRVIATSTKSGYEHNFSRFGEFLSKAVDGGAVDLDKDGQTSLLEAFLAGAKQTEQFYKAKGWLATEHPLLDDNGDKLGTPAAWFRGVRPTQAAKGGAALDGLRASQLFLIRSAREQNLPAEVRQQRDRLEQQVAALRQQKSQLAEEEYYRQLENLMLKLAAIVVREDD